MGSELVPFSCPTRIVYPSTQLPPLLAPVSDGTPATEGDGRSMERELVSAEGHWSNVDVHIDVPSSWGTPGAAVMLRLYAVVAGGRSLVAQGTVDAMGLRLEDGRLRGIALSGRGHPCSQWTIVARTDTDRDAGTIVLELWGTESTPDGIANTAAGGIGDDRFPSRAAHLLGYNDTLGTWTPVEIDPTTGNLLVQLAGPFTPADSTVNPSNLAGIEAFPMGWDPGAGRWNRLLVAAQSTEPTASLVWGLYTNAALKAQSAGGTMLSLQADARRSLAVRQDLPVVGDGRQPSVYKTAAAVTGDVVKASAGMPLAVYVRNSAALQFFAIVNKASAPALGDAIVLAFQLATGGVLQLDAAWFAQNGIFLSAGIAWGWSSTGGTFTAGAAVTGAINILFV
jgi:hypothetical protein